MEIHWTVDGEDYTDWLVSVRCKPCHRKGRHRAFGSLGQSGGRLEFYETQRLKNYGGLMDAVQLRDMALRDQRDIPVRRTTDSRIVRLDGGGLELPRCRSNRCNHQPRIKFANLARMYREAMARREDDIYV